MKSCLRVDGRLSPELLLPLLLFSPQLLLSALILLLLLSIVAKPSLLLQPECLLCQTLSMFQTQPCLTVVVMLQTESTLTSYMLLSCGVRSRLLLELLLLLFRAVPSLLLFQATESVRQLWWFGSEAAQAFRLQSLSFGLLVRSLTCNLLRSHT